MKYTKWILTFNCTVDMVDTLQQQAKHMEEELQMWEDEVQQARKEYYELNYYTTMQLLTLRKELGKLKTLRQPHVNPHVLALLQSISTEISPPCVCKVVKCVAMEEQKETGGIINRPKWPSFSIPSVAWLVLACLGLAWLAWLGVVSLGLGSTCLAWLGLAWLGMVWFGFSLANDTLASARASCISLQQPMLSYDQLSVKQKEIFDNLMNCGYSKRLILRAVQRFEDQHEAENWIIENASQYSLSDAESEGGDFDEEEEADSDSETESEPDVVPKATPLQNPITVYQYSLSDAESEGGDFDEEEEADSDSETESEPDVVPKATPLQNPIGMNLFLCGATVVWLLSLLLCTLTFSPILYTVTNGASMELSTPKTDDNSMIEAHVTQKQPVDEFHPTVQQLVEAGFSVEQSIDAVEHDDGLEGAMDYLLSRASGGGIFQTSTSVENHQNQEERGEEELQQERVM